MISCFTTSPLQYPVLPLGCGFKNHDLFRWYGVLLKDATEDIWKVLEMVGAAPTSLKSLSRADSSHACRHSLLADDDLNPFASSRTARIRHVWIGAYSNFHLFDGWRHAITTYPNSGFFRWHRNQTRLRVRTLRSQLLLVDFIEKPFDRLLHASTVSTPSRIWFIPIVKEHKAVVATSITYLTF